MGGERLKDEHEEVDDNDLREEDFLLEKVITLPDERLEFPSLTTNDSQSDSKGNPIDIQSGFTFFPSNTA